MNRTRNRGGRWLAAALCIAGCLLASTAVWAQHEPSARDASNAKDEHVAPERADGGETNGSDEAVKDEARRLWQEAIELARQGDALGALARFNKSQALHPHEDTLRNIALLEVDINGLEADGATHLAQYLAMKEGLEAADRKTLEGILTDTEKKVGRLDVDVAPANASLELDGTLLEPPHTRQVTYLAPGRHKLVAWLPDSEPAQRDVVLAAGQRRSLTINLETPSKAVPVAEKPSERGSVTSDRRAAEPAEKSWPEAKRWAVFAGGALTAVALGVGIYGEAALIGAKDDAKKARAAVDGAFDGPDPCFDPARSRLAICRALDSAASDNDSAARLANAGWIATGALAAATAAVWVLWPNQPAATSTHSARGMTAAGPWASSRGAGWAVSGRF